MALQTQQRDEAPTTSNEGLQQFGCDTAGTVHTLHLAHKFVTCRSWTLQGGVLVEQLIALMGGAQ